MYRPEYTGYTSISNYTCLFIFSYIVYLFVYFSLWLLALSPRGFLTEGFGNGKPPLLPLGAIAAKAGKRSTGGAVDGRRFASPAADGRPSSRAEAGRQEALVSRKVSPSRG